MKKLIAPLCALGLLLTGCGQPAAQTENDDTLHILATTYPVYLFTTAVTEGAEGVEVDLLVNQQTSCLHDYTLTVTDMKAIEGADVIVMNGAGLEDFMDDALAASDAAVIDCSEGLDLLPAQGHEAPGQPGLSGIRRRRETRPRPAGRPGAGTGQRQLPSAAAAGD